MIFHSTDFDLHTNMSSPTHILSSGVIAATQSLELQDSTNYHEDESSVDLFGLISTGSSFEAPLPDFEPDFRPANLESQGSELREQLFSFATDNGNEYENENENRNDNINENDNDNNSMDLPMSEFLQDRNDSLESFDEEFPMYLETMELNASRTSSSSCAAVRPQLGRRKSNPFYLPSRHIKNMISKDKQRKSCRKIQTNVSGTACKGDDDVSTYPQNSKPFLERRQTVS
ncbi:LANO_0B02828g1_1 [Lachancea nothofagi CBS 11611]|uniref:LANO_0B02828g1_1 n=1 Tax=Lachancea nothofagi CBS 11611 TaxID=1266666 RepID=A0A1G4IW99_9SACH|nr:LANO_0B02828g1_1 [Lachancea nothofagi CBS 11611]